MACYLVTGGAGFFGDILLRRLLAEGHTCVSVDLNPHELKHERLVAVQDDIRNEYRMAKLAESNRFDAIFHCAAILAHAIKDEKFLWSCNVDGTRAVARLAKGHRIRKVVFTSTNCLWARPFGRPVVEDDAPDPIEIYGKSKWAAERVLQEHAGDFDSAILRCPTIMDSGRLGLLAILFQFIDEGRKVWVVGDGRQRYQFIYAQDLASACLAALGARGSNVFNVGSDNVRTTREVYEHVIAKAGTRARVASLPRGPTLFGMKVAYALKLSPLGPYQYKMIAEDFIFDTTHLKRTLGWQPTLANEEMLLRAYEYYRDRREEILRRSAGVSAHRQAAPMGIIRVLKWLS